MANIIATQRQKTVQELTFEHTSGLTPKSATRSNFKTREQAIKRWLPWACATFILVMEILTFLTLVQYKDFAEVAITIIRLLFYSANLFVWLHLVALLKKYHRYEY
mmetsp:Transcript_3476/g.5218  ORF Transcript_3476/g.5218 Transcript_3476/m.5218 type:complete len:106 (-) Transcript_3476:275-592(-)